MPAGGDEEQNAEEQGKDEVQQGPTVIIHYGIDPEPINVPTGEQAKQSEVALGLI